MASGLIGRGSCLNRAVCVVCFDARVETERNDKAKKHVCCYPSKKTCTMSACLRACRECARVCEEREETVWMYRNPTTKPKLAAV